MITVDLLQPEDETGYDSLVEEASEGMLYHTLKWRDFLAAFVQAEPVYLVARDSGQIVGLLPAFIKRNRKYGNVLNSLPFFGSNGGVLISPDARDLSALRSALLEAFQAIAREQNCVTSAIISTPLSRDVAFYTRLLDPDYTDVRIGQMIHLPDPRQDAAGVLLTWLDSRRRRNVKKAIRSGIDVSCSSRNGVEPLWQMHRAGIGVKGGVVKPLSFFHLVTQHFVWGQDYRVYYAKLEGRIIAGLLLFYHGRTVEYYTPAFDDAYASLQPLALLIYQAMVDTIQAGYRLWNMGGTWKTQEGVYQFKHVWHAQDYPYYYYVNAYEDIGHILEMPRDRLLEEYCWFYVLPFSALTSDSA